MPITLIKSCTDFEKGPLPVSGWQLFSKNPIMPLGKPGEWDELCCSWGSVLRRDKNQWLMYYSGRNAIRRLQIGSYVAHGVQYYAAIKING